MELNQANQIVRSPEKVKVTYQGEPVWIQNIDEESQTARVYKESNPEEERTVPVRELVEES